MENIRTTITIREFLAALVRQRYGGNLSKGIDSVLFEHLVEEKKESGFGLLKGKVRVSAKDVMKMHEEDEKAHEKLYR